MGGGGGRGRGLSREETRRLSEIVSDNIKASAESKCNVFISFAAEDLDAVNLLRGQAKNENSAIEFNDWSLRAPFDSKNAEYIRNGIRERIRQSSVTIVYLSAAAASSKWVNWEIQESLAQGKGVVAMYQGDKPPALPTAAQQANVKVVPWNQEQLAAAIVDCRK